MENKNVLETNFNSAENEQDIDKSQYEYLKELNKNEFIL